MDKKFLENFLVTELKKLNELINDEIENKHTLQMFSNANRKGLALFWITAGIAISLFKYFGS